MDNPSIIFKSDSYKISFKIIIHRIYYLYTYPVFLFVQNTPYKISYYSYLAGWIYIYLIINPTLNVVIIIIY